MNVESRDSVSLKPAELDEFAQMLTSSGLHLTDEQIDLQVEAFPLAVVAMFDSEVQGVMLGSLERIGGTPAILWGLGVARKGKQAAAALKAMTGELSRRGRDLVPRRGRARGDAPVTAELLHAARELREPGAAARATSRTAKTARGDAASRSGSASTRTSTIVGSRSR